MNEMNARRITPRRRPTVAAVVIALALALAACTGSDDDEMSSATVPSGAAPAATTAPAQAGTDAAASAGQLPARRQIIVTGSLTVRVPDVRAAVADIQAQVTAAGGYLSGSNIVGDVDLPTAHLVFRIPSDRYDAVVSAAGRVGELLSQRSDTEDVTAQVVDLDARASALETSIGRLEGFLGAAADVEGLARIENELTARETALEQIRAQQRDLGDDIAYATLDVELVTVGATPGEPADRGFTSSVRGSIGFLGDVAEVIAIVAGFLLPIVPFVLAGVGVAWVLRRRSRTRRSTGDAAAAARGAVAVRVRPVTS